MTEPSWEETGTGTPGSDESESEPEFTSGDGPEPEDGGEAGPTRRRGARFLRWGALALVVVLGAWAGGWLRAWSDTGLTPAQADQATVRLTLDGVSLGQTNGCDNLGGTQTVLQIPLHNYSPGPVQISAIAVDPPGQAPGAPQKVGVTIAAGTTDVIEALIPIQLCTAHQPALCPGTGVELDATASVIPESGRVHEIRLPIGEWVPTKFLQLYEDAPFAAWGASGSCP